MLPIIAFVSSKTTPWRTVLWQDQSLKAFCLLPLNLAPITPLIAFIKSPLRLLSKIFGAIQQFGDYFSSSRLYRVWFLPLVLDLGLDQREEVKIGDLVSVRHLYNVSSHGLFLASTPSPIKGKSPVKGKLCGLKMVSSSLAVASPEISSRSFDEQSMWRYLMLATFIDTTFNAQSLFMMGERQLIIRGFVSTRKILTLETYHLYPFMKGLRVSFQ